MFRPSGSHWPQLSISRFANRLLTNVAVWASTRGYARVAQSNRDVLRERRLRRGFPADIGSLLRRCHHVREYLIEFRVDVTEAQIDRGRLKDLHEKDVRAAERFVAAKAIGSGNS